MKFVVQKHTASHLHYDFRLSITGKAKSWAIPKQPSNTTGVKRLAVQVPDHTISYMSWEGTIPKGQYGAGTVKIWDKGTYKMLERRPGKLIFELKGNKLKGIFCLIKFKDKNWLFFKKRKVK